MSDRLLKESDVLKIAFQLPLVVNSAFADAVKALPSADRPQGKWIAQNGGGFRCSECDHYALDEVDGRFIHVAFKSNYCPNCGARMI